MSSSAETVATDQRWNCGKAQLRVPSSAEIAEMPIESQKINCLAFLGHVHIKSY